MTRKHNLAAQGHLGHGRNLSQTVEFLRRVDQDHDQHFDRGVGWGHDKTNLR